MHLRVVTPIIPTGLTTSEDFQGILGPEDKVDFTELDAGPASIESALDKVLAGPDVVAKIITAERDGVDAVVIDCMEDPGLDAARECVSIPVLGPCQTSMSFACTLGHKFSLLSVSTGMGRHFDALARTYGMTDKYASTRSVEMPVHSLAKHPETLRSRLSECAKSAVNTDGADVIIIGCTGMSDVAQILAEDLRSDGIRVPVIDPIPTTLRLAKLLVESRLTHSRYGYPRPTTDQIAGFNAASLHDFVSRDRET
ncbi:MAG: aspartate/glutamate racemase family protein [Pseudomonadota bacterium]